jgi:hypothetical protein
MSKFAAQVSARPSSIVSTASIGILRIVDEMGATETLFSIAIAESRAKIGTDRGLFGAENVYNCLIVMPCHGDFRPPQTPQKGLHGTEGSVQASQAQF